MISSTHARGGTLDLLKTDISDLVQVPVVEPMSNSDDLSLSVHVAQAVPS